MSPQEGGGGGPLKFLVINELGCTYREVGKRSAG